MDPLVVSAAQTIIESERAKRTLDAYSAFRMANAGNVDAQRLVDIFLSRTSHLWTPTTKQDRQQREENKVDTGTLAFINSMI